MARGGQAVASATVWKNGRLKHGTLTVECTDSCGVPVVIVSDGVEHLVLGLGQVAVLEAMLRRAKNRAAVASGR